MINFKEVSKNPQILEYINQTEKTLAALEYTDHGLRHCELVAKRAKEIAKAVGLTPREQELASIAGFCHDMGNFLGRSYHNYMGALLFSQTFKKEFEPKELVEIMQAISSHDERKVDMILVSPVAAAVVLADKSDVSKARVLTKSIEKIKEDIHDRVNYATESTRLTINKENKKITLTLKIDTNFVPIMEYFEIFTERMVFCRKAAQYLGYNFGLVINKFKLL